MVITPRNAVVVLAVVMNVEADLIVMNVVIVEAAVIVVTTIVVIAMNVVVVAEVQLDTLDPHVMKNPVAVIAVAVAPQDAVPLTDIKDASVI